MYIGYHIRVHVGYHGYHITGYHGHGHHGCHENSYQGTRNTCAESISKIGSGSGSFTAGMGNQSRRLNWESLGRFSIQMAYQNQGHTQNGPSFAETFFWVSDYFLNSLKVFMVLSSCFKCILYQYVTHVEECLLNVSGLFLKPVSCIPWSGRNHHTFEHWSHWHQGQEFLDLRNPTFCCLAFNKVPITCFQQKLSKESKECTLRHVG